MAARRQEKLSTVRDALVDAYINRLKAVGLQRREFETVVAELAADKRARKNELLEIASKYVGVRLALRSRSEAMRTIEKRFVELVRFERKQEIASKTTPS
jgi:hypothetical protein